MIRQLSPGLAALSVLGFGIVGGLAGYIIGSLGDTLLGVDTRILGVVLGAVLGAVLPRHPHVNSATHAVAAGAGVAAPTSFLLVSHRAIIEVVGGMILVAVIGSAIIELMIVQLSKRQLR